MILRPRQPAWQPRGAESAGASGRGCPGRSSGGPRCWCRPHPWGRDCHCRPRPPRPHPVSPEARSCASPQCMTSRGKPRRPPHHR
eukprot:scaffold512195_cov17-Prasinocladus_malaysianus.AAC.1